jgi:hypothetical protein
MFETYQEAQEKQDANTETTRSQAASQSCPISEQSFMQYMQLVEERCQRDQEVQNKLVHHITRRTRERQRKKRSAVQIFKIHAHFLFLWHPKQWMTRTS